MEVILLEEQSFTFERSVVDLNFKSLIGFGRDVYIPAFQLTQELFDKLISAGLTPDVKVGQPVPGFQSFVAFIQTAGRGSYETCDFTLLNCAQILSSLLGYEARGRDDAKIQVEVTKIVCEAPSGSSARLTARSNLDPETNGGGLNLEITPTGQRPLVVEISKGSGCHGKDFEITTTMGDNWINYWTSTTSDWNWTFLGSVKLVLSRITAADPAVQDLFAATRKMLTDDIFADTTVVAQNGAEIMFHRSILAGHSPAFERMFKTKMKETATGVLELPDMTEESVRAMKEYLYVWELKAPRKNPLVCFELFEAGHKYGISTLEEATSNILLKMDGAWYSAVVGLRLYLLVKDMEMPRLKQKAVEILKLKLPELKSLDQYRDLFRKENADVAMELTECLALT